MFESVFCAITCKVLSLTRILGSRFCSEVRGVRVLKLKSIYLGGGGVARLFILIPNFLCVTMIINPNVLRIFQYFPLLFFGFLLLSIVFHCLLLFSVIFHHFPLSSVIFHNLPSYFIIIYRLLGTSIYLYCILSYVSTLQYICQMVARFMSVICCHL